jgi:hypothetical protein
VLTGKDQPRRQSALAKRMGDGRKLDRFRPGADDQANIAVTQPSP